MQANPTRAWKVKTPICGCCTPNRLYPQSKHTNKFAAIRFLLAIGKEVVHYRRQPKEVTLRTHRTGR